LQHLAIISLFLHCLLLHRTDLTRRDIIYYYTITIEKAQLNMSEGMQDRPVHVTRAKEVTETNTGQTEGMIRQVSGSQSRPWALPSRPSHRGFLNGISSPYLPNPSRSHLAFPSLPHYLTATPGANAPSTLQLTIAPTNDTHITAVRDRRLVSLYSRYAHAGTTSLRICCSSPWRAGYGGVCCVWEGESH
jgi:hypothetical protein